MLSNAYFLAKFRFDTAENEPSKNLQNFRKMNFSKMHPSTYPPGPDERRAPGDVEVRERAEPAALDHLPGRALAEEPESRRCP